MSIDIVKYKYKLILLTLLILLFNIGFLTLFGLNLGIEFTGGTVFEYRVEPSLIEISDARTQVQELFAQNGISILNTTEEGSSLKVNTPTLSDEQLGITEEVLSDGIVLESFESIGSLLGQETIRKSIIALITALVGILLYIAYAFRNIPKPYSSFKFGVSAIIAMLHDVIVVAGVFALLGRFLGVEIDLLFVTALLTVIGFSVNDTIVVFDRLRENLIKKSKVSSLEELVNKSIIETLRRSIGTSVTLLIILVSMFLLGGESIKYFILAFIIGIIAGTYSSIFVASPVYLVWESSKSKTTRKKKSKKK